MMVLYMVLLFCLFILLYFIYMIIKEGICRVVRLYYIAFTGWNKKRNGYRCPDSILALKKLNYIFAKYTLYRMFSL